MVKTRTALVLCIMLAGSAAAQESLETAYLKARTALGELVEEARKSGHHSAGTLETIVLDPGHGGSNEGAYGVAEIYERSLTLTMARALREVGCHSHRPQRKSVPRAWIPVRVGSSLARILREVDCRRQRSPRRGPAPERGSPSACPDPP